MKSLRLNFISLCVFLLLFCPTSLFFTQNYQVIYKVDFHPIKDSSLVKTEYMNLDIKSKYASIFYNSINDGELMHRLENNRTPYLRFTIIQNEVNYNYYGVFNDLSFNFSETLQTNWKITNNVFVIKNYKVQEAKIDLDGRTWIALFTTEIPISKGPYKFSGLPGLILKVYSTDGDYNFEMVELTKNKSGDFLFAFETDKYKKLKKDKIETFIHSFLKDPGSQNFKMINSYGDQYDYKFSGNRDSSYKEMNDYLKNLINKYNNPINKKIYILVY